MTSRILLSLAAVAASCGAAAANPLNLVLQSHPDIVSLGIDVVYTSGTLSLMATGFSISYENDGLPSTPAHQIFGGMFNINLAVTNAGVATAGTLSISGAIPSLAIPNQTLLTGTIADFGFTTVGVGRLEFLFGSLGGLLAPAYLAQAPLAGVILNSVVNFPGNFNSSWNNLIAGQVGTGSAVSDTAPIPAPGAAVLLAVGAALMPRRRR